MGIIPRSVSEDKQAVQFNARVTDFAGFAATQRRVIELKLDNCLLGHKALVSKTRKGPWSHFRGRMRDIEKLIKDRHGEAVPQTDDAFIYLECICNLLFVEYREDFIEYAVNWGRRWYPWASQVHFEEVAYERTKVNYVPLSADALAHVLHLTYEERQRLRIRTIGACDVSKRQRGKIQQKIRQLRDCERKREKRRKDGKKTRTEYLAGSLSAAKPWDAFGICRRTWEKRGKPNPHAVSSHIAI